MSRRLYKYNTTAFWLGKLFFPYLHGMLVLFISFERHGSEIIKTENFLVLYEDHTEWRCVHMYCPNCTLPVWHSFNISVTYLHSSLSWSPVKATPVRITQCRPEMDSFFPCSVFLVAVIHRAVTPGLSSQWSSYSMDSFAQPLTG